MTASLTRPRRGRSVSLANGLRHDHTVTCTAAGIPTGCNCPFSFWAPREQTRRRVRVVGTEANALRLREHMQREASSTIFATSITAATPQRHYATPRTVEAPHAPARSVTLGEWAEQIQQTIWLRRSPRTRQSRASVYRNHIEPHLDQGGWTAPDTYIWRGGHHYEQQVNKPYERQGIYRIIRRVLKRVGLENVTRPHGLRATGAQLLIEAGASLELVSQHLGHRHVRTTEEYYVGTVKTSGGSVSFFV